MNFKDLPIIPPLHKALEKLEFTTPTPIQEKVIPLAIEGKDILGIAQTGSGKTLAFTLPILQNIYNLRIEREGKDAKVTRKIQALIVAPTRELAIQIGETFAPYATNTNLKCTTIFGGVNDFHQIKAIEKGVDILIATPGRLEDLITQGVIKLSYVEIFVLDEADKMLDMGFLPDIKKLIKRIPEHRQTLFFSATMPAPIKELAASILKNPETITIKPQASTTDTITQKVYHIASSRKRQLLQQIVKRKDLESIIVFVRTQEETDLVLSFVRSAGIKADNIHRNRSQNARTKAIKTIKSGEIKVLVATDIASRGIDINGLSCVVNYSLPKEAEVYVHRIGRTARAGKSGLAISMCIEEEKVRLDAIEKLINKKLEIVNDTSYKDEEIVEREFLGTFSMKETKPKKSGEKPKRYYGGKKK
ncbi:MAG: DEAD/DEAH box helicase [Candidatus Altimarinota bacterium]